MNEQQIRQIVREELRKAQFNVSSIPFHIHNGTDSNRIPLRSIVESAELSAVLGPSASESGVLNPINIGVSTPPNPTIIPVPIIQGYGVGPFSTFNPGLAPIGSLVVFENNGTNVELLVYIDGGVGGIWKGVTLT